ncbi:MAG TPA: acyclic terpene utilization AtuA family protein [Acidimicrobiales bacterium]|nr:acyclic terpene utilization AtuA family protein [Acidimicrobiales bacterium]
MSELRYLAATGSLGAGFKESSLWAGVERRPDFIGCDAGSTDGGPYSLGAGGWLHSPEATRRDLRFCLLAARRAGVPLLIGSCGGGGTDEGVDRLAAMAREIAREEGLSFRLARIYAEPDREAVVRAHAAGRLRPLVGAPEISADSIRHSARLVAMMGTEPFAHALEQGADVVLAGRASDASIYSAIPEWRGFDRGLTWHAAKIMECGSAATANRRGQDCMFCTLDASGFVIEALDPELRCTPVSVAAHTLYENGDPFHLIEPSGTLDTTEARFEALDDRRVRVTGSRFKVSPVYTLKLEGVEFAGYASLMLGSVRDPVLLGQLDSWLAGMRHQIEARLQVAFDKPIPYQLSIRAYGASGTLGAIEPTPGFEGHEALLLFDVVAPTQAAASAIMKAVNHVALHFPVPDWTGSITGLAQPYSPQVLDRGPVWRFNINHAIEVDDPLELYRFKFEEVS